MIDYKEINRRTMVNTLTLCESIPELRDSIVHSISAQKVYWEHNKMHPHGGEGYPTTVIVSNRTTLDAAKQYIGSKIAVLNFANNHSVGGAPFSSGVQEETLCHCTTLYPCLEALEEDFYKRHSKDFDLGKLDFYGNDDTIFTPGVVVFKDSKDEPEVMYQYDWFSVDVISSAAPNIKNKQVDDERLFQALFYRIKRILDVAEAENDEILILGAFGCGAFANPPKLVASIFKDLLVHYNFKLVEFAIKGHGDGIDPNFITFNEVFNPNQE